MKRIFTILLLISLISFSSFAQVEKKLIVEHFTNTRCSVCGTKNPGLYDVLDDYPDVIHIAYHPSSPYSTCVFSQHNPLENDARTNYYGIYGATPLVVFEGQLVPIQNPMLKPAQIEAALGQSSDYSISVKQTEGSNNNVEVKIVVRKVSGSSAESLSLRSVLAEKEVNYNAPNGESKHHDVFRKILVEQAVSLSNINDSLVIMQNYLKNPEWDKDEMVVITVLENTSSKEILQADESDFVSAGPSGIFDQIVQENSSIFYPNPATTELRIRSHAENQFELAEIYDLTGTKVLETSLKGTIDISGLSNGLFIVILTGFDKKITATRVSKIGY